MALRGIKRRARRRRRRQEERFRLKMEKLEQEAALKRRAAELGLSDAGLSMDRERPIAEGLRSIGSAVGDAAGGIFGGAGAAADAAGVAATGIMVPVVAGGLALGGLYLLLRGG